MFLSVFRPKYFWLLSCLFWGLYPTESAAQKQEEDILKGVNTFDLILIHRHIIGESPLGDPYKIIAADANRSHSITTADIIDIRKLILGIDTMLPHNSSWRFIDKSFRFTNPNNPFPDAPFPEKVTQLQSSGSNTANFVAVKVGDVNGSATASRPETPAIAPIAWPLLQGRGKQETISIPVIYTGQDSLLAFQIALQFDPQVLQLISPSAGDLPEFTQANYNITEADHGRLRLLWFPTNLYDETQRITPGATLFYLHFKTLAPIPEGDQLLQIDNNPIPGMAWAADGQEFSLEYTPAPAERFKRLQTNEPLEVTCLPNPGSTDFSLTVKCPDERKARLALYDANGVRVVFRDVQLQEGKQHFIIHEAAVLPAGVYIWKVISRSAKVQGHWIKI